jgi:two-component system KDP operon response regulator KdpE
MESSHMPLNLLIIDDDSAVTELLSLLLKTQGFEVIAANRGADGVKLVREKSPDLIILDLMMPEMDGWAVCKEVRSFSNVPIIILSALNDPLVIASILDAGADDYLTKPTLSSVLVAHINKLVRRSATGTLSSVPQKRLPLSPNTSPLAP